MNTNAKRIEYSTRDAILSFLSDGEIARLSMREAGPPLALGDEYVDLEHPTQGIRRVHAASHVAAGMMLPRSAVGEGAWSEICARLTASDKARPSESKVLDYGSSADLPSAESLGLPGHIDVYFENVSGSRLRAAIANLQQLGRITACGTARQHAPTEPWLAPKHSAEIVGLRLTIRGIIVQDQLDLRAEFLRDMERWIKEGKVKWRALVEGGIENAPSALLGLFNGEYRGNRLVQVGPNEAARRQARSPRPIVLHADRQVEHERARNADVSAQPTGRLAQPEAPKQARIIRILKGETAADSDVIAAPATESLARAQRDLETTQERVQQNAERVYEEKRRDLVVELLPVLDNLDRTLDAATSASAASVVDGVRIVRAELEGVLFRYGVQRVDTVAGQRFDPALHEAVAAVSVVDPQLAGAVIRQATPGYRFAGKLLRAAKVSVGVRGSGPPAGQQRL